MTRTASREGVGAELRRWREHRALSQLALASRAEVSTRHLSYVENGRSRPTPEMILKLADELDVPLGAQNQLLLSGGYAPQHPQRALEDQDLSAVMDGLRALLDAHAPWPALLLDDHWDLVDANNSVEALLAGCDPTLLEPPINVLRLALHPRGLAPRIRNLAIWRSHLMDQLAHRLERTGGDAVLQALHDELLTYPGGTGSGAPQGPVVVLELETRDGLLRFFSVAGRLDGPTDVTLDALHLETFVPADEETRQRMAARSPG